MLGVWKITAQQHHGTELIQGYCGARVEGSVKRGCKTGFGARLFPPPASRVGGGPLDLTPCSEKSRHPARLRRHPARLRQHPARLRRHPARPRHDGRARQRVDHRPSPTRTLPPHHRDAGGVLRAGGGCRRRAACGGACAGAARRCRPPPRTDCRGPREDHPVAALRSRSSTPS